MLATSTMLSDIGLGFTGLFAGFFIASAYCRYSLPKSSPSHLGLPRPCAATNDEARADMAAEQLRDVAQNVAGDVGDHCKLVNGFSGELGDLHALGGDNGEAVRAVISKMLVANNRLQYQLKDAERRIEVQAEEIRTQQSELRTDSLTSLANRRAFDRFLKDCNRRFDDEGRPFSLIMADIDNFKQFNDAYGHLAGDEVLRVVASTLARVIKSGDLAARFGGEEFTVVMPGCKAAAAQVAVERIRSAIQGLAVEFEGQALRVTASLGVAECTSGESELKLIRRADLAVYASKTAGRNCSHWHNGQECLPINAPGKRPAKPRDVLPTTINSAGATARVAVLPDRAVFARLLQCRIAETHRTGAALSVIHLAVNDFTTTRDLYGYAVAELLCDSLATLIKSSLREMDTLGRLDVGQFAVMLPACTESAAKIVAQRIKTEVACWPVTIGDVQLRIDLDFGVAGVGPGDDAALVMAAGKRAAERNVSAAVT